MKKLAMLLFIPLLILTPVIASTGCDDDGIEGEAVLLKLSVPYPSTTLTSVIIQDWCDAVTERTDGKVTFDIYWAGTLLTSAAALDGVKNRVADMAVTAQVYTPNRVVSVRMSGPGLLTRDYSVLAKSMSDYVHQDEVIQDCAEENVRCLSFVIVGPFGLMATKPINNLSECEGVKVRGAGFAEVMFESMGMENVSIPFSEMIEALQKGTVECIFGSIKDIKGLGLEGVIDHWIDVGLGWSLGTMILINLDAWNGISEDLQDIMMDTSFEIAEEQQELNEAEIAVDRAALEAAGKLTVITFPAAEIEQVMTYGIDGNIPGLIDQMNAAGLPGDDLIDYLVSRIEKYEDDEGIS